MTNDLEDLSGVGPATLETLNELGIESVSALAQCSMDDLVSEEDPGFTERKASKILGNAQEKGVIIRSGSDAAEEDAKRDYISSGINDLDELLGGGWREGTVHAIGGPAACHEPGTEIMMFDGRKKLVEDVEVGDSVMGPDGGERNVLQTNSGEGEMFEIDPYRGEPFCVNEDHVLTLKRENDKTSMAGDLVDIPLREWFDWSDHYKKIHRIYRPTVDFSKSEELELDPYFLGVVLGDGSLVQDVRVTATDEEIINELKYQSVNWDVDLKRGDYGQASPDWRFVGGRGKGETNHVYQQFKSMGMIGDGADDKHIPQKYLTARKDERKELLAGLIDTDGSVGNSSGTGYDFISASKKLSDGVSFLARSLGLISTQRKKEVKLPNTDRNKTYHRVYIGGETWEIPCRVERKKLEERELDNTSQETGFNVESVGEGEYYGFTIDKDHRYLMGDFTVTHNSGKTQTSFKSMVNAVEESGGNALYIETEPNRYSPNRLQQLASEDDVQDRIFLIQAWSLEEQGLSYDTAREQLDDISLVVVDSFTSQFRLSDKFEGRGSFSERSTLISRHIQSLQKLAIEHNVPVILIAQAYGNPKPYSEDFTLYGGSVFDHSVGVLLKTRRKKELTEVELEKHPSEGPDSMLINITDDDLESVN